MGKSNGTDFPRTYQRNHGLFPRAKFHSSQLTTQSEVVDRNGIRKSVISDKWYDENVKTMVDLFEKGLKLSTHLPCLGRRPSTTQPFEWMNYEEVDKKITAFGSGLAKTIKRQEGKPSFVGIYSRNSPEWVITMHACAAYSYVYVPLYSTLGKEAMQHIMNQTQLQVVLCHSAKEATLVIEQFGSMLKCVIISRKCSASETLKNENANNLKIMHFDEFVNFGHQNRQPKQLPKPEDLCTLCYTSGSTGIPKGVMVQHDQLIDALFASLSNIDGKYAHQSLVHLCLLPLAHIMEQIFTNVTLLFGAQEGFLTGGPETLTSDASELKPTVLTVVPRVLDKLRAEYMKKIPRYNFVHKRLQNCIDRKVKEQNEGKYGHCSVREAFFFKKFRRLLGGRVGGIICGGARLPADVATFSRAAFGCPIIECYGSTETCGVLSTTLLGETRFGIVGAIAPHLTVKLADVPDMGIVYEEKFTGEICVRGKRCTKGYYDDPENTAKLLDEEGWLHTGDVARFTETGALQIFDRCKHMFKTTYGEYIAPEKVEGIYQTCPLVVNVLLDGISSETFTVTVVHPDLKLLRDSAVRNGLVKSASKEKNLGNGYAKGASPEADLCQNRDVRKLVLKQMNELGRKRDIKTYELAKNIHLTPTPFSIENGLLTPTLKLARYKAREWFQNILSRLYAEGELK